MKVEIATLESLAGQCRAEAAETTARGPPPDVWTAAGAVDHRGGQEGSGT